MRELQPTIPANAAIKAKHATVLQQLTTIITNRPAPRVGDSAVPRVGQPSSSTDPTNKQTVRATHFVHQRRTRANQPIGQENEEPSTPQAIQPRTRPRRDSKNRLPLRRSTRTNQGGRTSAKTISTKKLTHLLKVQAAKDKKFLQQQATNEQVKQAVPQSEPEDDRFIEYNIPTPKGCAPPIISQGEDDEPPTNNFVAPPRNTTTQDPERERSFSAPWIPEKVQRPLKKWARIRPHALPPAGKPLGVG